MEDVKNIRVSLFFMENVDVIKLKFSQRFGIEFVHSLFHGVGIFEETNQLWKYIIIRYWAERFHFAPNIRKVVICGTEVKFLGKESVNHGLTIFGLINIANKFFELKSSQTAHLKWTKQRYIVKMDLSCFQISVE